MIEGKESPEWVREHIRRMEDQIAYREAEIRRTRLERCPHLHMRRWLSPDRGVTVKCTDCGVWFQAKYPATLNDKVGPLSEEERAFMLLRGPIVPI